jgi:two-component system, LytTR family, sensor kinase
MKRRYLILLIHVLVWSVGIILVYAYDFLSISYFDYREYTIFSILTGTLINGLIFYLNSMFFFPKLLEKHIRAFNYILVAVIFTLAVTLVEGFSDFFFNKLNNAFWDNIPVKISFEFFDLTFLINFFFLILSIGYSFIIQWYKNEMQKRTLIEDKIQTELALLKTQINPHFLFNTLNNIYGIARKSENKVVAKSIAKLAEIMRYITYETKEGKIELSREITYIKNYIELQKLKFTSDDNITIDFKVKGEEDNIFIEPMLFLPLVENCFKHGISLQKESKIFLYFQVDSNKIVFNTVNTIFSSANSPEHSGTGLTNLRKRLDLLYPDKHELLLEKEKDNFHVALTLFYDNKN